jgi:hypothetical protein
MSHFLSEMGHLSYYCDMPAPASSHLAADGATKDLAKAMLRLAAQVLSGREMVDAVREANA